MKSWWNKALTESLKNWYSEGKWAMQAKSHKKKRRKKKKGGEYWEHKEAPWCAKKNMTKTRWVDQSRDSS